MNTNELKNLINDNSNTIISDEFSLFQRQLVNESSPWLKQVEAKAKQLKTGKLVLIAVLVKTP